MKRKENGKSGAVAFGQLVKGLPLLHGSLQRHTVCNGIAAAGVDSLNFLHLLTGQVAAQATIGITQNSTMTTTFMPGV